MIMFAPEMSPPQSPPDSKSPIEDVLSSCKQVCQFLYIKNRTRSKSSCLLLRKEIKIEKAENRWCTTKQSGKIYEKSHQKPRKNRKKLNKKQILVCVRGILECLSNDGTFHVDEKTVQETAKEGTASVVKMLKDVQIARENIGWENDSLTSLGDNIRGEISPKFPFLKNLTFKLKQIGRISLRKKYSCCE